MSQIKTNSDLEEIDRWILWDVVGDDDRKVPKSPSGDNINPLDSKNWMEYSKAKDFAKKTNKNLGFVFVENDDLIGIDLDDVIDPRTGELEEWAEGIVNNIDTLWEVSPSRTGLHGYVRADIDRSSYEFDPAYTGHIEIYSQERFFTVTENWYKENEIREKNKKVNELIDTWQAVTESQKREKKDIEIPEDQILDALDHLDPDCSYNRWRNIGYAIADYYGENQKERAKEIYREWSQNGEKYDEQADKHINNIIDKFEENESGVTVGTLIYLAESEGYEFDFNIPQTRIRERDGRYYIIKTIDDEQIEEQITSFTLIPQKILENENGQKMVKMTVNPASDIEEGFEIEMELKAWNEPRDFREEVCIGRFTTFEGGRQDLNELRKHVLNRKIETKKATQKIGIHDGRELVTPENSYRKEGESKYEYIKNGSKVEQQWNLELDDEIDEQEVGQILELLPQLRDNERFLPVLGWYYSTLFAERIRELEGEACFLGITGDTGAGKSTTNELLNKLWGLDGDPTDCTSTTKFALEKLYTSTQNVPIWLDEYKPTQIEYYKIDALKNLTRNATRGATFEKGRPDQSVNLYEIKALPVISGEQKIQGSAIQRRQIPVDFKKVNDSHREAKREIETLNMDSHARAIYQYTLENDIKKEAWIESRNKVEKLLDSEGIEGVRDLELTGLTQIRMGLSIYKHLCHIYNVNPGFNDEEQREALLYIARQKGEKNRESHLDEFVKLIFRTHREILEMGRDYRIFDNDDDGGKIRIKIENCHNKLSKYIRDHGLEEEYDLLAPDDYKQRIRDTDAPYVDERVYDRELNRCTQIDVDTVEESFEVGV